MSSQNRKRQSINPPSTQPMYEAYHFSQATWVGDTIWVFGQLGLDADVQGKLSAIRYSGGIAAPE